MRWDAVVVGAGPNGLSAAITLAAEGLSTLLIEANDEVGGAARTAPLTLPGFSHDVGSAVYPMGLASPFFASLPLDEHGLDWVHPDLPLAHPLDGGRVATLHRSLDDTTEALGGAGPAYREMVEPFVEAWPRFRRHVLDTPFRVPTAPLLMARFATRAFRRTTRLAGGLPTPGAQALLAGNAAHAGAPLDTFPPSAVGLVLMIAGHAVGWPVARGGAGAITEALAAHFRSLGGTIETGRAVTSLDDLPEAEAVVLALTPAQIARIGGDALPARYRTGLERWRYGPGAFKVDWALDAPIPWTSDACRRAGTVHLGGTLEEIAAAEGAPARGRLAENPFVLLAQPSLFDPSRAPEGRHTAWAYCHVPNGWRGDATEVIERQVERFAPGFRDTVLERCVHGPSDLEAWDGNLVGGDVNGGALTPRQWLGPERWSLHPWSTPVADLYVCSAATPPGGGVHGMCGHHAARSALRSSFGIHAPTVFGSPS
ncbi:MAG: NAD(P)/FAD-dependent oxidoreductase [Gemmatimonadota bacterium]|nr:NAD(P)/FAD-dependent oxidoreductase [Gemmatimonadota bacterium]